MEIKLNTQICSLLEVSLYESLFSPDTENYENDFFDLKESGAITEDEYDKAVDSLWSNYDMSAYKVAFAKFAFGHLSDSYLEAMKALPFGITGLSFTGMHSPKEYNFESDELDFVIETGDDLPTLLQKWVAKNGDIYFYNELESRYGSRDGFISFMPCGRDALEDAISGRDNADIERAFAMILHYALNDETGGKCDFEEIQEEFTNLWLESSEKEISNYFSDVMGDEFDKAEKLTREY